MSNNYQPIQNENYKIISFNIRHSSHLNIWEASLSSDSGLQVLFIPEHTHALAHQNKDEKEATGFRRFVLVRPKTIGNGGLFGL